MSHHEENQVIDFTPENGFVIEKLAQTIVKAMSEMNMDAHLNLPGSVVLEIEKGCTEQEIIEGYNDYMSARVKSRPASNRNEKLETV
jgi:hypothetical protein